MITVLIRVAHGPEALAMTLSALVPAVADGLIADAVILIATPSEAIASVAEAAGATLVVASGSSWKEGARHARRPWLLCLDDGDLPQEGWIRVLDRFINVSGERYGRARLRRRQGLLGATRDAVRTLLNRTAIRPGDLVRRDLVRDGAKPGPMMRLGTSIERDPALG